MVGHVGTLFPFVKLISTVGRLRAFNLDRVGS